jgi:dynein heavy chain
MYIYLHITRFRGSVAEIEKMTEVFIKESFRKLRSAEGAFELVQNFQKIGMFLMVYF